MIADDARTAAEIVPDAIRRFYPDVVDAIAATIAAARAEEAARWQAKIEAVVTRAKADGRADAYWINYLRAVLDGERQEHNLGVNGDWCLTHGEPYPHDGGEQR